MSWALAWAQGKRTPTHVFCESFGLSGFAFRAIREIVEESEVDLSYSDKKLRRAQPANCGVAYYFVCLRQHH